LIRVGPAGWSYPDWEGIVYPRPKPRGFHPLSHLARFVQCLEVNSTFYAVPRPEASANWARLVREHDDFRLMAKLHRDFTHRERADSKEEIAADAHRFLEGIDPLVRAHRLAALLVQFPLSFRHGAAEVRRLGLLHSLFGHLPLVLEVRHASWFTPPALSAVAGLGYSLAHIDLPDAWNHPPNWHEATGRVGYLRLHGRNSATWFARDAGRDARYDYLYTQKEVRELTERARRIATQHDETYVVTNNHYGGKAIANALEIMAGLRECAVAAPPELVRSFPRLADSTHVVDPLPRSGQQELF
jgi:uncharacterized protein YecE (DUF72 family)